MTLTSSPLGKGGKGGCVSFFALACQAGLFLDTKVAGTAMVFCRNFFLSVGTEGRGAV